METQRVPWYLLTGLVIGFVFGLILSQLIPLNLYAESAPNMLAEDQKDAYRLMIAEAYQANPDLLRASSRLELLQDTDPFQTLSAQAQRLLGSTDTEDEAKALALLAAALELQDSQP